MMPDPLVSVVVSTYDRPARLARLLDALRAQTLGRSAFEVIVVDNGSGPETGRVLAAEVAQGGLALRTAASPSPGARRAGATPAGAWPPRRWSPSPTTTAGRHRAGSQAALAVAGAASRGDRPRGDAARPGRA